MNTVLKLALLIIFCVVGCHHKYDNKEDNTVWIIEYTSPHTGRVTKKEVTGQKPRKYDNSGMFSNATLINIYQIQNSKRKKILSLPIGFIVKIYKKE